MIVVVEQTSYHKPDYAPYQQTFFQVFFNALNLNKDQHLIFFAQYYCWFIYWDIRHQVNDRQPEKLWLWNKFSTSVSKEMYREVYGVDSDVKMKQVNITIY